MKTNWSVWIVCSLLISFNQCSDSGDDSVTKPLANNPEPVFICGENTFPVDASYVLENSPMSFSWAASTGATAFDVYLGQGSNVPTRIASDLKTSTFRYTLPAGIDITYSWYVHQKDAKGDSIKCPETTGTFISKSLPAIYVQQKVVNVLVLNYDPHITTLLKTHEYYHWANPRDLAEGYINEVSASSDNLIKYVITEWRDLDEFPMKDDKFRYTASTYKTCMLNSGKCHSLDGVDYVKIIKDQNIVEGIDQDLYEEVWIFGAPYFGFWEAAMAGPKAFNINGGFYQQVVSKKAFAIMGFNYERGVTEMVHDLCHRTEATMSKVYNGWAADKLTTSWARFAANAKQSNGVAGVGSCHYPPNATVDYDYSSGIQVMSSADDYFNYPLLSGSKKKINSETWGGLNYQGNYLNWWFKHLPHREGVGPDGKLNCWWRYVFEFNETILAPQN